jgi:DNA-binding NarL/FixJ family response regulator
MGRAIYYENTLPKMAARARLMPPRQREVLTALGHGKSRKIIADNMSISVRTVDAYCALIYLRLGLESNMHAMKLAMFLDWV